MLFWRRKPKDDFYITLLKYARDKTLEGEELEKEGASNHVRRINGNVDEGVVQRFWGHVVGSTAGEGKLKTMMNQEAYFQLLEYEEMEQARSSSKWALQVAIVAILITLGVSAASLIVPFIYPTNIDSRQENDGIVVEVAKGYDWRVILFENFADK